MKYEMKGMSCIEVYIEPTLKNDMEQSRVKFMSTSMSYSFFIELYAFAQHQQNFPIK